MSTESSREALSDHERHLKTADALRHLTEEYAALMELRGRIAAVKSILARVEDDPTAIKTALDMLDPIGGE